MYVARTGKGELVVDGAARDSAPTVVVNPLELVVLVRRGEPQDVQRLLEGRVKREVDGVHGCRRAGHRSEGAGLAGHHQELA